MSTLLPISGLDEKSALRTALVIAHGTQLKNTVWGQSPHLLQSLIVTLCSPSEGDTDETLKIRLDALTAIVNQGFSVNGEPGTTGPLHAACAARSIDIASALLTFGADPKASNEEGRTPQEMISASAPEAKTIARMIRATDLKMTALQAVRIEESHSEIHVGAKDMLVARAYRSAAKKMGL